MAKKLLALGILALIVVLGILIASSSGQKDLGITSKLTSIANTTKNTVNKINEKLGSDTHDEEVLGTQVADAGSSASSPSQKEPLIDCTGADGKVTKQTQSTCDYVNKFWAEHPPAPVNTASSQSGSQSSQSSSSSTSTPTPGPLAPAPTITEVQPLCVDFYTCNETIYLKIFGTNLDTIDQIYAVDVSPGSTSTSYPATSFRVISPIEVDVFFYTNDVYIGIGNFKAQVTAPDYSAPIQGGAEFTTIRSPYFL